GERTTRAHLRMANLPQGSALIRSGDLYWPTVAMENVFVLPGVPWLFRMKVDALQPHLDSGASFKNVTVYTRCDEGAIAARLAEVARAHPDVSVGSYLGS